MRKRTGRLGMSAEDREARRSSIGGSDAKIILSGNQDAITSLWLEKRGEKEVEVLDDVLLIALGNVTEPLNMDWFEQETGLFLSDEQRKVVHPEFTFIHSTLDAIVNESEEDHKAGAAPLGIYEAKFMLPFYFSVDEAIDKYYPQLQHNMLVNEMDHAWLSIICGGAHHLAEVDADMLYQATLLEAERDFWDCVQSGRVPGIVEIKAPEIERVRTLDMRGNNEWASLAADIIATKTLAEKHETAKKDLKKLFPDDALIAEGHGVKIHVSKDGKKLIKVDDELVEKYDNDNGIQRPEKKPAKKRSKKAESDSAREAA